MATDEYINALGGFVWQFARLEWAAVYIAVTLNNDDWATIPLKQSSNAICKVMKTSIESMAESKMTDRLSQFATHYKAAIRERNGLLHVHPYSAKGGTQQLGGKDRDDLLREWTLERLKGEILNMRKWEVEGNALVHELRR